MRDPTRPAPRGSWTCLGVLLALIYCKSAIAQDPSAELYTFDGVAQPISAHVGQGQWVVLMFWASDCHVCNEEMPGLERFHRAHVGRDASMLGVATDGLGGRSAARGFLDRHGVSFPSLIAAPEAAAELYRKETGRRWIGTPTFLLYAPDGTLAAQQVGAVETALIESFIKDYRSGTQP